MAPTKAEKRAEKDFQAVKQKIDGVGKKLKALAIAGAPLPDHVLGLVQGAAALPSETAVSLADLEPLFAIFDDQLLDSNETVLFDSDSSSQVRRSSTRTYSHESSFTSATSSTTAALNADGFSVKNLMAEQNPLSVAGAPVKALCSLAATVARDRLPARVIALFILRRLVDPKTNKHAHANLRLILEAVARTSHSRNRASVVGKDADLLFPAPPGAERSVVEEPAVAEAAPDDVISAAANIMRQRKSYNSILLRVALCFLATVAENAETVGLSALHVAGILDDTMILLYHLPSTGSIPSALLGVDIRDMNWPQAAGLMITKFTPTEEIEVQACRIAASFYRRDDYYDVIHQKSNLKQLEIVRERSITNLRREESDSAFANGSQIPHKMRKTTFYLPTYCGVCTKLLSGLRKQGFCCPVCKIASHEKCLSQILRNCRIPPPSIEELRRTNVSRLQTLTETSRSATILEHHSQMVAGGAHSANRVLSKMLKWAALGLVPFHNELSPNDIEKTNLIYQSKLCKVYVGRWNNRTVAIKEFVREGLGFDNDEFFKEIALQRSIRHPRVVRAFGACTQGDYPFIVMDYFPRGSLHQVISGWKKQNAPIDFRVVVSMLIDCAQSLGFLHDHNIIHRDIKSMNFLVSDHYAGHVMDFGVSRVFDQGAAELKMTLVGTPVWMAPEVISNEPYTGKADVYSFGLVMWQLVSRQEPFVGVDHFQLERVIVTNATRPPIPSSCLPDLAELIKVCWDADPRRRPSFHDIVDYLYAVVDPKTGEAFAAQWARLSEAALPDILPYLSVADLFNAAAVSKGWYVAVSGFAAEVGIARPARTKTAEQTPGKLDRAVAEWRRAFRSRHSHAPAEVIDDSDEETSPPSKVPLSASATVDSVVDVDSTAVASLSAESQVGSPTRTTLPQKTRDEYEAELSALRHLLAQQQAKNQQLQAFHNQLESDGA